MHTLLREVLSSKSLDEPNVTPLEMLTCHLFDGKSIDKKIVEKVLQSSFSSDFDGRIDQLFSHLSLLIISKLDGRFKTELPVPLEKASDGPLMQALLGLYHTIDKKGKLSAIKSTCALGSSGLERGLTLKLSHLLCLGVCQLIIGLFKEDDTFIIQGLQVAELSSRLFHQKSGKSIPLWVSEHAFSEGESVAFGYLLFHIAARVCSTEVFDDLEMALHRRLVHRDFNSSYHPLAILLGSIIEPSLIEAPQLSMDLIKTFDPAQFSLFTKQSQDHIEAVSLTGHNTGLGGVLKGELGVVNCGPSFGYVGDCNTFGISKLAWTGSMDTSEHGFKGWTRLNTSQGIVPNPYWMELEWKSGESEVDIGVRFTGIAQEPTYFAFFLKGEKVTVNENIHLNPDSLDKYDGESAFLTLHGGGGQMCLNVNESVQMQVIPLAGKDFFWGANFVVAYNIYEQDIKYKYNLKF